MYQKQGLVVLQGFQPPRQKHMKVLFHEARVFDMTQVLREKSVELRALNRASRESLSFYTKIRKVTSSGRAATLLYMSGANSTSTCLPGAQTNLVYFNPSFESSLSGCLAPM